MSYLVCVKFYAPCVLCEVFCAMCICMYMHMCICMFACACACACAFAFACAWWVILLCLCRCVVFLALGPLSDTFGFRDAGFGRLVSERLGDEISSNT